MLHEFPSQEKRHENNTQQSATVKWMQRGVLITITGILALLPIAYHRSHMRSDAVEAAPTEPVNKKEKAPRPVKRNLVPEPEPPAGAVTEKAMIEAE
jgi:hypothetical protein